MRIILPFYVFSFHFTGRKNDESYGTQNITNHSEITFTSMFPLQHTIHSPKYGDEQGGSTMTNASSSPASFSIDSTQMSPTADSI